MTKVEPFATMTMWIVMNAVALLVIFEPLPGSAQPAVQNSVQQRSA